MSECHKIAIDYETNLSRTCRNVWEMSSDAVNKTMESNSICFIKVIECLQYLARQGVAFSQSYATSTQISVTRNT